MKMNNDLVARAFEKLDSIDNNIVDLKETLVKVSERQLHDREQISIINEECKQLRENYNNCDARIYHTSSNVRRKDTAFLISIIALLCSVAVTITTVYQSVGGK